MPFNSIGSKIYILSQFLVIAVVLGTPIYLAYVRRKRAKAAEFKAEHIATSVKVSRTPLRENAKPSTEPVKPAFDPAKAIPSALPTWEPTTPPHEILGVHPQAPEDVIEKAYKKLLKQYHPDLVAHWGKGYQARAHQIVLLIQEARAKMLGKK